MAMEAAMGLTNRLLAQAQALAAVTAYLRLQADGQPGDPALRPWLERVVDLLGARNDLDGLSDRERGVVVAFARSYLRQAMDLADEPARPNAWSHTDPTILQAQGRASAVVARLMSEAGLAQPGARILDVGTGVAGLAIALCETFPGATVVGIDPWEPSLALARANVLAAGLEGRITLRQVPIEGLDDAEGFDVAWFPSFFIPEEVLDDAVRQIRGLLRPGGRLVAGVVEATDDPLAGAVDGMITVRSGGSALEPAELVSRLRRAGFAKADEVPRTWRAPLRLVAAE